MARPQKQIDEKQVEQLAAINCSLAEMAAVLDCSVDTLDRRFAEVIKKGRAAGRMSLKRKQYEVGMKGNVSMLIWLGKQTLGQRDNLDIGKLSAEQALAILAADSGVDDDSTAGRS